MTHTDTDIAEILQRFDALEKENEMIQWTYLFARQLIRDFIYRECLALKKKWEREHFDNQD